MIAQRDTTSGAGDPTAVRSLPRKSAWILALLFAASVINYLDRQSLSILARTIQTELHLTDLDYARIVQAFLLPYALSYLVAGRLTDWLRPKRAMIVFIVVWSAANLCTGFVRTGIQLGLMRFVLGLSEPGNWLAAPKAIAETFTIKARPLAMSIISAGATVGAALSPPIISFLALHYGWRSAFFTTGALGILWVAPWALVYPKFRQTAIQSHAASHGWRSELGFWKRLLALREVWLLAALRMVTDPVWYFYLFWFPKYLGDSRHLSLAELGKTAWIVYVAADVGAISAGFAVSRLIAGGRNPVRAAQIVMTALACIAPVGAAIPFAVHMSNTFILASCVAFAQQGWSMLSMAMAFSFFSPEAVGTAWGIASAGSGLGGFLSTSLIGRCVTKLSYTPVFAGLAVLNPLSLVLLWSIRSSRAFTHAGAELQSIQD